MGFGCLLFFNQSLEKRIARRQHLVVHSPRFSAATMSKLHGLAPYLIQVYRIAVILAIAWMVRQHHVRVMVQGDKPITISEVRELLPDTHTLRPDSSARAGLTVLDKEGNQIGYALRTMPHSRKITGYSGPTDGLIVLDAEDKVVGVTIRHSYDTPSHVRDVSKDYLFMETWNGLTWDQVAGMQDLRASNVWGVSGATRTSEALAQSVAYRAALSLEEAELHSGGFRFGFHDVFMILVATAGVMLAFIKRPWIQRRKLWVTVGIFIYLGIISGDLLAQSLLVGWAESGIPWRMTPGLVILAATAFLVPLGSQQPVYCTHICPHGHAQRWLMKVLPAKWTLRMHGDYKWGLKALPALLLAVVLITTFLRLPLDLAGIEPFDAYLIRSAGVATICVAVVGLVISLFVPMAYCKYGCPTGYLLEFVRKRKGGGTLGWTGKDSVGLAMLALTLTLFLGYERISSWLLA